MMMQMVRLFGLLGIVALIGASHAQSLADRLRDAGNISFKINNADYAVNIGTRVRPVLCQRHNRRTKRLRHQL
jgi:hypothetical protein